MNAPHPEGDLTGVRFRWPGKARAAISFTFDDARSSQLTNGLPIFDRHGVHVTFFVDTRNVVNDLDAWQAAAQQGHEIANHTTTHPCSHGLYAGQGVWLESFTLAQIESDILEANRAIAAHFGRTPASFAYPCGQTFIGEGEQRASYKPIVARHFMTGRGFPQHSCNDPLAVQLEYLASVQLDCATYEDVERLVLDTVETGGWLVFTGHDIGDGSVRQTVDAGVLDRILGLLDRRGDVMVDTVEAVATHLIAARPSDR